MTTSEKPKARRVEIKFHEVNYCLLGTSPFVMNQISETACQSLLLPGPRKTRMEQESKQKHNPLIEYRSSIYRTIQDDAPSRVIFTTDAFHQGMAEAAKYLKGGFKTDVLSVVQMPEINVHVYGLPFVYMSPEWTDSKGRKIPDIRTRAIFPYWATELRFLYMNPPLTGPKIDELITLAGVIYGAGDKRKKGYGRYKPVMPDDPVFLDITQNQTLAAQDQAIQAALPYSGDNGRTERLFSWAQAELGRRAKLKGEEPDGETEQDQESVTLPLKNNGKRRSRLAV